MIIKAMCGNNARIIPSLSRHCLVVKLMIPTRAPLCTWQWHQQWQCQWQVLNYKIFLQMFHGCYPVQSGSIVPIQLKAAYITDKTSKCMKRKHRKKKIFCEFFPPLNDPCWLLSVELVWKWSNQLCQALLLEFSHGDFFFPKTIGLLRVTMTTRQRKIQN